MEENYKLEKEYKVPADTFRDAYLEFQNQLPGTSKGSLRKTATAPYPILPTGMRK